MFRARTRTCAWTVLVLLAAVGAAGCDDCDWTAACGAKEGRPEDPDDYGSFWLDETLCGVTGSQDGGSLISGVWREGKAIWRRDYVEKPGGSTASGACVCRLTDSGKVFHDCRFQSDEACGQILDQATCDGTTVYGVGAECEWRDGTCRYWMAP